MPTTFKVTVSSLSRVKAEKNYAIVTFLVERGMVAFDVPIPVDSAVYDEADFIRVARGLLHFMISELAEDLQDWALSEPEWKTLGLPDRKRAEALSPSEGA